MSVSSGPGREEQPHERRGRVLYVDTDPAVVERVVDVLTRKSDLEVVTESDAEAGLERVATEEIDCVVSGYQIPGMDGLELLGAVRRDRPELPFVLFVGSGSEALASEAISAGVTDYVRKGGRSQYEVLASRIEDAIETHRSQATYRDLFAAVDDAILVHDPETGDVVDVNRAMCDFWGYSYREACECTVDDLSASTQPASARSVRDWIRLAIDEGAQRVEWLCETHDGERFWADVSLKPATLDGREYVIAIVRDITEQKQRQRELETFRKAIEHAGHSIYITATDGEIHYVNPAFEETTGYDADEAIGRTPRILKSGEHEQEFYRELWSTILTGNVWQNRLVNERKDGDRYVVNQTIAPIVDETGDIVRFVAVNADITEQKRREQQLQALYRAITEWLDARSRVEVCELVERQLTELLDFDLHGICLYDESTERLVPTTVSESAAATFEDPPTFEKGEGVAWKVFEAGEPKRYDDVRTDPDVYDPDTEIRSELAMPLGDHGVLLIGSTSRGAFDETDEAIVRVLASALTEVFTRIERERTLEEQNTRLEEFAAVVSHDLRNPLSIGRGYLELAMETDDESHLDEVMQAHDRIERIVDDLLWLTLEGRGIGETKRVELSRVAADAWTYVETGEATLQTECGRTVEADPDRLQQLLENLFRNAVEHGGSDVTVRVGPLDAADGFYVEDDGPGIPRADRDRVLEAGYSTAAGGTGYGLSIVQTIVDAHGWQLGVTGSSDGGARFEIRGVGPHRG